MWHAAAGGVLSKLSHRRQHRGAPEGDRCQQQAASGWVVCEMESILAEHLQVVPAGWGRAAQSGSMSSCSHTCSSAVQEGCCCSCLAGTRGKTSRQGTRPHLTVSSSVGDSSSGCGASSGCLFSTVLRCSRSKLYFSSAGSRSGMLVGGLAGRGNAGLPRGPRLLALAHFMRRSQPQQPPLLMYPLPTTHSELPPCHT